jgi:hypothetical protein
MNQDQQRARVRSWLAAPLGADVAHSIERLARAEDVAHIAIMPDVHLASDVCVGVALATHTLIYRRRSAATLVAAWRPSVSQRIPNYWRTSEPRLAS